MAGGDLVVWGGALGLENDTAATDGAAYAVSTRQWRPIAPAPGGLVGAVSVWTGRELVVWGGAAPRGGPSADGYAYDPAADRWRTMSPSPLSARSAFGAVWTGTEVVVFGSRSRTDWRRDGAAWNPATDSWRPIADAPHDLNVGSMLWTGHEILVVGSSQSSNNAMSGGPNARALVMSYSPIEDAWHELSPAPLTGQAVFAAWADGRAVAYDYEGWASTYDPGEDRWTPATQIAGGGECVPDGLALDRGRFLALFCFAAFMFDPEAATWTPVELPPSELPPPPLWTGGQVLFWGSDSTGRTSPRALSWVPPS